MAIELTPVSSMTAPAVAPDKTGKAEKPEKSDKSDKSDKADKTTDAPLSGFMAMLAQFDLPVPAAQVQPVDKDVAVLPVVDPAVPLPQPVVLDPAALLGQMQIGLAGQALGAKSDATQPASVPVPAVAKGVVGVVDVGASAGGVGTLGKGLPPALAAPVVSADSAATVEGLDTATSPLAKRTPKSSLAAAGDSLAGMLKPAENAQIGDATGKSAAAASDKQPLTQSLQAALNVTMASAQNATLRADKAGEGAVGLNPTATLGESFRQLVEVAKSDKPAEITTSAASTQMASATERTHAAPAGGAWDFSAAQAPAMSDAPGVGGSSPTMGFAAQAQGSNQVALWVSQNVQSAELKLDAQSTDPVEVSISLSGGEAQVQFRSNVAETRELLSRAVADLDSAMQREGLVLSGVSVGTSAQGRDNSRAPGEEGATSRQSGVKGLRGVRGSLESRDAAGQMHRLNATPRGLQGRVDVFV